MHKRRRRWRRLNRFYVRFWTHHLGNYDKLPYCQRLGLEFLGITKWSGI